MNDDEKTCTACGAAVRWVITEGGRRVQIDPTPVDGGNVVPVVIGGRRRARILGGSELPHEGPAWVRHSQTCTESPDAKARRARNAPRCRACLRPMDPELARLERWTEHPACDTAAAAATVRAILHREAS